MSKLFYLSTRLDRSGYAAELIRELNAHGWERTFEWEKNEEPTTSQEFSNLAVAQLTGVCVADVVIVLLPGGRGTYTEIGAALALGKPVILHAPDQKTLDNPYRCTFHYHPAVKVIVSDALDPSAIIALLPA